EEEAVARREGWIWVKGPQHTVPLPGDLGESAASRAPTASEHRGLTKVSIPERFEFFIGGYGGPSYRVALLNGELEYERFDYAVKRIEDDLEMEQLPPISPNWRTFRRAVDRLDVWAWEPRYEARYEITDGTSWSLLLQWGDDLV